MKKINVYSTPSCIYCHMAKDFLKANNVEYTDYDLSVDAVKRDEIIKKTGQMGVPVIEIDDEIMIGFDKARISELLGIK